VSAFLPGTAYVAFSQDGMKASAACVSPGDRVAEGEVIARSKDEGSVVHSPIPGTVENFVMCVTPNGRKTPAAKIRLSGGFSYLGKPAAKKNWLDAQNKDLKRAIADKGVINTFFSPVPLASQISSGDQQKRPVIAARLFDNDPSQKTDSFIAEHCRAEVAEGAAMLAKTIGAERIVFAAPQKTLSQPFFSTYKLFAYPCSVSFLGVNAEKYPAGTQYGITKAARDSDEDASFSALMDRALFVDSCTLRNVYRAIAFDLPVMETCVHVAGQIIKNQMLSTRVGTLISGIVNECGGFTKTPKLIIVNGKILGMSIDKLDIPVTKYVKSLRFLSKPEIPDQKTEECVRCGHCRSVCPVRLEPDVLFAHAAGIKPAHSDAALSSALCTDCMLCNAGCPARLPISQFISFLKESLA
jgi:electron transport complex protein RnfC